MLGETNRIQRRRAAKLDLGGTVRTCHARESLARVRPWLKTFGITRVANITGLDAVGIPVAVCIRPNARHLSVSQGKGVTRELAEISAIMESIEMYHAERLRPPDRIASFREISRWGEVADPARLDPGIRWAAYNRDRKLAWVGCRELLQDRPIWAPHGVFNLDSTAAHPDSAILSGGSNGLASGNHYLEAALHGIFEVVERDSESRWRRLPEAEQADRLIDLDTLESPLARSLLDRLRRAGLTTAVWNITSETGLPAYRCIVSEGSALRGLSSFHGSGCHLSKEVALTRALTEAAQTRLTLISGSRDDISPSYYREQRELAVEAPPDFGSGRLDDRICPAPRATDSFEADLELTLRMLERVGVDQVAVLDHARAPFGIPVVHVLIPGMHFLGGRI